MTTRVLLIDPDITFMVSIKQALEGTGEFRVALAANGPAAEDTLRKAELDVAVVDFALPDMDAMELIRLLRQIQPGLLVILCPQTPAQQERVRFMDVQGAVTKPYTARDLIPRVQDVVRRSQRTIPKATDEFSPPQMPADLRDLVDQQQAAQRPPSGTKPTPTDLLDQVEREKLMDDLAELDRPVTGPLSVPGDILAEFEALERAQTGPLREVLAGFDEVDDRPTGTRLFDDQLDEPGATRVLPEDESPHQTTAELQWPAEPPETRVLDQPAEPPDTTTLLEWEAPPETGKLDDTSELPPQRRWRGQTVRLQEDGAELAWDDSYADDDTINALPDGTFDDLIQEHGWDVEKKRDTKPLGPHPDEPPRKPDDTPSVPPQDLDGVRQFLATDQSDQDPSDFGEVLDAVAQSQPTSPRSPQDRVFHELVDSMRMPEDVRPRRTRLEDLLASIAADAPADEGYGGADSALDYVLDAIRRGASPTSQDPDAPAGAALDDEAGDEALGDTTIGQVIDGLFDPSFEGVLAALAGEDVSESDYDEPTYALARTSSDAEPAETDQFLPDEMAAEDAPDWLTGFDAESVEARRDVTAEDAFEPEFIEPPVTKDDSAHYPATTALSAVTSTDDDDDFSLNQLLSEIEEQLPPARTRRPRLKPLPSWQKDEPVEGMQDVSAMFDHIEGRPRQKPSPEEIADVLHDQGPDVFADDSTLVSETDVPRSIARLLPDPLTEPPLSPQDTRPSTAWLSARRADDSLPEPEHIQPPDTWQPDEEMPDLEAGLLSMDDLFALADLPVEAGTEEIDQALGYQPAGDETGGESSAGDEASYPAAYGGDAPDGDASLGDASRGEFPDDAGIAEAFYAGVSDADQQDFFAADEGEQAAPLFDMDGEHLVEVTADEAARWFEQFDGEFPIPDEYALDEFDAGDAGTGTGDEAVGALAGDAGFDQDESDQAESEDTATEELYLEDLELAETGYDDFQLDAIREQEAGSYAAIEDDDEADLAQMAVMLTQYSLESSAQATMVTRPGEVLADAGQLSDAAMDRLFEIVDSAWQTSTVDSDALIRFITLPGEGEFLLYSKLVEHDLALSMVFHANTPVRTIRRQARRLGMSLDLVPEMDDEPPAAKTLPNRPTDLRPPVGLRESLVQGELYDEQPIPSRPVEDSAPQTFTAYTCLWLPFDPGQELLGNLADDLYMWIQDIVEENAWQLEELDVRSDYVVVSLSAPEKVLPDTIIAHLMAETASRTAEYYPDELNGSALWTDGYYVVSPPRELTEREIARFITYQRQAQLG